VGPAAAMAATPAMASNPAMPREKLVELLVSMLQKKGPVMVAELERRVAAGQGLQARGITADAEMLQEALEEFDARQVVVVGKGAVEVNSPPKRPSAPPVELPKLAGVGGAVSSTSTATGPGQGARWMPAAPSATLLVARAQMECENAETFMRTLRVVGSVKVGVLTRPDMAADFTGTILTEGDKMEVVARFLNNRDGRVYFRLKSETGWVSIRSRKEFTKIVLGPLPGEAPIEPARFNQPIVSTAMRVLPELDSEAAIAAPDFDTPAEDLDADEDELVTVDAVDAPAEEAADDGVEMGDVAEEAEEEDEEDEEGKASDESEVDADEVEALQAKLKALKEDLAQDTLPVEAAAETEGPGKASSPSKVRRFYHKFKVVVGRCPILEAPNAQELMAHSKNKVLQLKQEFIADGVFFAAAEQRYYLRLTKGRGWVCEQSSRDLRRWAVLPLSKRKQPLSKKMARAVAFRGGDTGGMTKMGKDDLIKNKYGKIVSKKASEAAAKRVKEGIGIGKWTQAVKRARDELQLKGFVAVKKGSEVYELAQKYYKTK